MPWAFGLCPFRAFESAQLQKAQAKEFGFACASGFNGRVQSVKMEKCAFDKGRHHARSMSKLTGSQIPDSQQKGGNVVKLTVRDKESIQEAVRRFRKLVERSGIKKEMRRREYYEKPSEIKRRARLRAERRNRRTRLMGAGR
jgi:small subunit ribosomal protein S21